MLANRENLFSGSQKGKILSSFQKNQTSDSWQVGGKKTGCITKKKKTGTITSVMKKLDLPSGGRGIETARFFLKAKGEEGKGTGKGKVIS